MEKVKVSGFAASFDAIINGSPMQLSQAQFLQPKLAVSPRGLRVPVPLTTQRDGSACQLLRRFMEKCAWIDSEIDKQNPPHLSNYPYPILVANDSQDAGEVYAIVKAMVSIMTIIKMQQKVL